MSATGGSPETGATCGASHACGGQEQEPWIARTETSLCLSRFEGSAWGRLRLDSKLTGRPTTRTTRQIELSANGAAIVWIWPICNSCSSLDVSDTFFNNEHYPPFAERPARRLLFPCILSGGCEQPFGSLTGRQRGAVRALSSLDISRLLIHKSRIQALRGSRRRDG